MQMVLIRLSPSPAAGVKVLSPEVAVDILWAAATPEDRLEHIRARHGPTKNDIDIALFHKDMKAAVHSEPAVNAALRLCHRAISVAPVLGGWLAEFRGQPRP